MARQKAIQASEHTYNVLLQPEPEGGYTVTCPSLPGLVTYGETLEEARAMAAEAIEAYLESQQIDGEGDDLEAEVEAGRAGMALTGP